MRPIFLPLLVLTLLGAVPATADVGASLGLLSGDADDGKNVLRRPFRFEAPALTFELAGGKDEGRSPRASADAKILRVTWAGSGTFESYQADHGWRTDDEPDLTYVQVRLTSGMGAWHGLGGIAPLSLALDFEGQGGYLNILDGADGFDAKVEEAWLLFPFSATLLLDGPLGLSPWASAGYDPVTGAVSLFYKNVHQSWLGIRAGLAGPAVVGRRGGAARTDHEHLRRDRPRLPHPRRDVRSALGPRPRTLVDRAPVRPG